MNFGSIKTANFSTNQGFVYLSKAPCIMKLNFELLLQVMRYLLEDFSCCRYAVEVNCLIVSFLVHFDHLTSYATVTINFIV
jgi:hypothetical protein